MECKNKHHHDRGEGGEGRGSEALKQVTLLQAKSGVEVRKGGRGG